MEQFIHEEVPIENTINVRFKIYEDANLFVPEHWHQSLEIIYLYEGEMDVTINRHKYHLSRDDFMVINSAAIHSTQIYNYARVLLLQIPYQFLLHAIPEFDNIRFDFPAAHDRMEELTHDCLYTFCGISDKQFSACDKLRHILITMGTLYTQKPQGYSLRFSSLLYEFLYTMTMHYQATIDHTSQVQSQKNLQRLAPVIRYVREHYQEPISLEDAARLASLNPEYFCRFFKRNMGTTFTAYINSVRLTHICEDLKNTDLNIGTILENNGLTNYKLFIRNFKQIYGCTPKEFRKNAAHSLCQ